MYTIKMDGNTVWDNRTPEVGIYEAKVSLKDNSTQTLDVNVAAQHDPFPGLKMMQSIITVYQDDEANPIFEGRPISRKTDFYGNITYQFEGCLGYLYDSIQSPAVYTGQTIEYIFRALIEEHNKQVEPWKQFQVGNVTVVDIYTDSSTYSGQGRLADNDPTEMPDYIYQQDSNKTGIDQTELTTGYESTFDAINNLLVQNLSGHLVVRYENGVKYLDYLKDYLPSEGQIILFGSNLLDYSSTLDYSSICTGILPLGYSRGSDDFDKDDPDNPENPSSIYTEQQDPLQTVKNKLTVSSVNNGSKIIWNDEAVQNYGRIVKMKEWSNIKDPQKLYDKAKKYLLSTQFDNLSLECKIVDLHFVDKSVGPLHHMHMVRVKSDPIGMDRSVPISEMDIDLLNPANDTVTLGATYNSISGKLANTSDNLSSVSSGLKDTQTTIENNNNTYWTNITKTDQAITLEAENRDKAVSAALKVTADQISSEVSARKESEKRIVDSISSIKQTAEGISTEVKTKIGETEAHSIFKQDATSFTFKASQIDFKGDKIKLDTNGSYIYSDNGTMYMYVPDLVSSIRMQKGDKMIGIDNNGIAISASSNSISTPSAYDKKVRNIAWFNGSYLCMGDLDLSGFATISDLQNIKSGYIKKSVYNALVKRRDALVKRIKDIRALTNKTSVPDRHLRNLINSEVN